MSNFQNLDQEEIEQDELKSKLDLITITTSKNLEDIKTAVDANTSKVTFPGFGTSASTALAGDTSTISPAQSTAINSNSLKTTFPGFGTSGGTALEGNTSLLQLGTTSSTALAGNTALLQIGTSAGTALEGDTVTISSTQATAIVNNTNKTGISTTQSDAITANTLKNSYPSADATKMNNISISQAVDLDTMESNITNNNNKNSYPSADATKMNNISITQAVDLDTMESNITTNTTSITNINNAYPKFTNTRRYAYTSGDVYNDGKVKFYWDGVNRQLRFWVLDIPTGDYTVGGVQKWATTSSTQVANYISRDNSTYYHYFTGPQLSGAVLNSSFNLSTNYSKATYFLSLIHI